MTAQKTDRFTPRLRAVQVGPLSGLDGWHLIRQLGTGTRTVVYLAKPEGCAEQIPPDYAVKVLASPYDQDSVAINLLRREATVGRLVSHRHVVPILGARVDQAPYYLVMPRLNGLTLRTMLHCAGHLVVPRAIWFARQVAEGLDTLHQSGWLHGDVKPSNIVVSPDGHLTLIDLGFARRYNDTAGDAVRALMGTLKYAAPESFVASRREDARSDLYSLGVTLYEMLTGHVPFDEEDPQRLAKAHLEMSPRNPRCWVPQLPSSVARLLQRILAKDPMRRPQSARELTKWLVRLETETFALLVRE